VDIQNTAPFEFGTGGIGDLILTDSSQLNMTRGEIYCLSIKGNATSILRGGRIDNLDSWQTVLGSDPHIEMFVKNSQYNVQTKILRGTWGDDSLFNIQLIDRTQYGYSPAIDNIKFTVVPEPMTLGLIALGGILVRRRE
jgi:hypothetical protein